MSTTAAKKERNWGLARKEIQCMRAWNAWDAFWKFDYCITHVL